MTGVEVFAARLAAVYAVSLYMPMSRLAGAAKRMRRKRPSGGDTRLAQCEWSDVLPNRPICLVEIGKRHGNVKLHELAILAQAAAGAGPRCEIIEIGTFDGRTTLNFAVNAPPGTSVVTLDLPDNHRTEFQIEASERVLVEKPASGARIHACRPAWRGYAGCITQMFGDSATFDWTPHHGRAGLVFVDGSHAYQYARKDSETAFRLVQRHGLVIWHDYGVWPGVTRALEELEAAHQLGLRHIRGTGLAVWRAPEMPDHVPDVSAGQERLEELNVAPTEAPFDPDRVPTLGR
jgi:hypothetical protein